VPSALASRRITTTGGNRTGAPGAGEQRGIVGRKDSGQLAVALIDTFEGAVMRAKVERSRARFDSFERFVLPSLLI
jgi:hypothetical protein